MSALPISERSVADRSCRFRRINQSRLRLAAEVTHACDLRCPHCFVPRDGLTPAFVDLEQALAGLTETQVGKIILTGGEPLLRLDLEKIVCLCSHQGLAVDLNSNLYRLTPERAKALVRSGVSEISTSLYGLQTLHDEFVGQVGAWEKVVQGIGWFQEQGVPVDVHTALIGQSQSELNALADLCESLSCDSLTFFSVLGSPFLYGETMLLIKSIRDTHTIPIRTIGLLPFDSKECVMGKGIAGLTAALEWKPCLLARRSISYLEDLDLILNPGDWIPGCDSPVEPSGKGETCSG